MSGSVLILDFAAAKIIRMREKKHYFIKNVFISNAFGKLPNWQKIAFFSNKFYYFSGIRSFIMKANHFTSGMVLFQLDTASRRSDCLLCG